MFANVDFYKSLLLFFCENFLPRMEAARYAAKRFNLLVEEATKGSHRKPLQVKPVCQ
jgi:hypothetical protein